MFRKSILRLFRLNSISFVQTESVMIITVCFLLFFHTMSSCPIPSRVRIEEGLFEASSSLFHVKWCLKGLIFETFIHFLRKKLFENKERPKSTRFCDLVLNTSSPPARSSRLTSHSRCGHAAAAPRAARVHGKASVHAALLAYVNGLPQQSSHELSGLPLS